MSPGSYQFVDRRVDRVAPRAADPASPRLSAQPFQQHRGRQDHGARVGLVLARMSGAEPCCAWAMQCVSPALIAPPSPRLPDSSEARSERMSPNMLVVTITSKRCGVAHQHRGHRVDELIVGRDVRISSATARHSLRNSASEILSTLTLCT